MRPKLQKALEAVRALQESGNKAYLVGGAVRDYLLNRDPHDFDIVTTADARTLLALFPRSVYVDTAVPLVTFSGDGYVIEISKMAAETIEADLGQRDFTINAIALDEQETIIDPFSGQEDLKNRVLRAVGDAKSCIEDDPLRILRAARFKASLKMTVTEVFIHTCIEKRDLLADVALERIGAEFMRLLQTKEAERGLHWLYSLQLMAPLVPKIFSGTPGAPSFIALDTVKKIEEKWVVFLYAMGEKNISCCLRKMRLPKRFVKKVSALHSLVMRRRVEPWNSITLYDAGLSMAASAEKIVHAIEKDVPVGAMNVEELYKKLPLYARSELAVHPLELSHFFKREPGAWLGKMLRLLETAVVEGHVKNEREELIQWVIESNEDDL